MSDSKRSGRQAKATPVVQVSSTARTIRETVESIVIAFVLAFLFRTFEAEAFVIPTGSMAPTLQGRHKDIECPKCGRQYRVSASIEDPDKPMGVVVGATCPQCGYHVDVSPKAGEHPSYNGDRILVGKFAYEFSEPERWDVIVFKYPEEAQVNYIKRLVGLPGETVRIVGGNIYTRGPNQPDELRDEFVVQRKPADKLRAMLQLVHDNEHQPEELITRGWPRNWQPEGPSADSWSSTEGNRTFVFDQADGAPASIRYHHLIPDRAAWRAVEGKGQLVPPTPRPIVDHYSYNDGINSPHHHGFEDSQHWVGDLAVEFDLTVQQPRGTVTFELVRGGKQLQCTVDLTSGQASLSIPSIPAFNAIANTKLNSPGSYDILFTNVDDELRLYVDGSPVKFDNPTTYDPRGMTHPADAQSGGATDTAPVAISAASAAIEVSELKVLRDIYYTAVDSNNAREHSVEFKLQQFPEDPQLDQFFVLGDNSPQSKDSRLWERNQHYVERKLLIGKALWIYWPHSFDYIDAGDTHIPFPFFPNFSRMGYVR